ncbi:hypothetical protein KCU89_g6359, partial [Aureobasidium melanogenum]
QFPDSLKSNADDIKVVNRVLQSAQQEAQNPQLGDGFYNKWVVIEDPAQQTVSKPTESVAVDFQSGFLNYSLDQVKAFVNERLGEGGLGQGEGTLDHLSGATFGIIDERTARDNTVLLLVQDLVDDVQQAAIRLAWSQATEYDKALTRCSSDESTDEDIALVARTIATIDPEDDDEQIKDKIADYLDQLREDTEVLRWFEFRIDAGYSILGMAGLYYSGATDSLLERAEFDENGVLRGPPHKDRLLKNIS